MAVAANLTERKILQNSSQGFMPGSALKVFLPALRTWAQSNGLPHAVSSVYGAPPFCLFLLKLEKLLPEELRELLHSAEAIAQRFKRIKSEADKRKGTQTSSKRAK